MEFSGESPVESVPDDLSLRRPAIRGGGNGAIGHLVYSIREPLAKRHSFCTLPEASAAGVISGIRKSTESMAAVICFHQPTAPSRKTVLFDVDVDFGFETPTQCRIV